MKAGDLVIGDARVMHAAHANASEHERPVITIWYFPDFSSHSEAFRATVGKPEQADEKSEMKADETAWSQLHELEVPLYSGDAEPLEWNRKPDQRLI